MQQTLTFSVSLLAFLMASNAFAVSADPRGLSAEETIEQTQQNTLQKLEDSIEKQSQKPALDRDEAADELEREATDSSILSQLPSLDNLAKLERKMKAQPNNLDHYFAHAQMAEKLGEYALAAATYEQMLQKAPTLDRVRLDLGSLYLRLGRFEEAKDQLQQVLAKNIPDAVRTNVENVMAKIEGELNEHDINGLISAGINWDSNANSAPKSDSIVIQDIEIPLTGDQLAQKDLQFFTSAGINHTYRPRWAQDEAFSRRWKNGVNYYRAKQSSQEALNVEVYSLSSGPEFVDNQSGIRVHPKVSYTHINLAGHTYLRSTAFDTTLNAPITERLSISASGRYEHRNFQNSPTVSTFELRDGMATQFNLSAQYVASEADILSASLTHRREKTQEAFFNNEQTGGTLGYTRILDENTFLSSNLGYKYTDYDAADTLISFQRRHDHEYSAGLTVGRKLDDSTTASLGYQFRGVRSNIRNSDYDNHRISASVSKSF